MLEQHCAVTSELLSDVNTRRCEPDAVVITADLRAVDNIAALREMFEKLSRVRTRIFITDHKARLFTVQAHALGATRVLVNPVKQANLLAALADSNPSRTISIEALPGAREAAASGATALASMFSAVQGGRVIDVGDARSAGRKIADSIAEHGSVQLAR